MKRLIFFLLLSLSAITVSAQQYIEKTGDTLNIHEVPSAIQFKLDPLFFNFFVRDPYYISGTEAKFQFKITPNINVTVDSTVVGIVGVCYSTDPNPEGWNTNGAYWKNDVIMTVDLKGLTPNTIYYYRPLLIMGDQEVYGPTKSFCTTRYVDLGLSVYWAAMNVGANEPEETGGYYAWGETKEHASHLYSDDNYAYYARTPTIADILFSTKYDKNDNKTILEPNDDAAYVNKGKPWRMPTLSEVQELVNNCNIEYLSDKNLYKFTSKINGNSIFFPATGCYNWNTQDNKGTLYLWTSQLYEHYDEGGYGEYEIAEGSAFYAYYLSVDKDNRVVISYRRREDGLAVRPVYPKE